MMLAKWIAFMIVNPSNFVLSEEPACSAPSQMQQKSMKQVRKLDGRPMMAQTSMAETATDVQSLVNQVRAVHVKKIVDEDYDDDTDATAIRVNFNHDGKLYEYNLCRHNVYSKHATVSIGGEAAQAVSAHTYKTRAVGGSWSTMTWHEDGSVHGLFEDSGRLMEVKPVSHLDTHTATMLRQSYKGEEVPHVIKWVSLSQLAIKHKGRVNETKFSLAKDHPMGQDGEDAVPVDVTDPGPLEYEIGAYGDEWGGTKWYPNCYTGDDKMHEIHVSIVSDKSVYDYKGKDSNAVKADLEGIVAEASFIYEMQMNIRLVIGNLEVTTTDTKFGACPIGEDPCTNKLMKLQQEVGKGTVPAFASAHIFTACGDAWGVVGLAYMGSLCHGEWATGANKFQTSSPWLTYAHELGHNLNADHTFEEGQGKTGGVMDYGDGKLDGHYQFNTKYRKEEVCGLLDATVNNCDGNFILAPVTSPTPAPEGGTPDDATAGGKGGCTCDN